MRSIRFIDNKMEKAAEKLMELKIQKRSIDAKIKELEPYAILCLENYTNNKLTLDEYTLSISKSPTRYDFSCCEAWKEANARKIYLEKCMKSSYKDDLVVIDQITGEIIEKPKALESVKITKLTKK